MIIITDVGLSAIANANAGGFLVNLKSFAVTEQVGVVLQNSDNVLEGTPVFYGLIESVEVVIPSSVKLTLPLPQQLPTTGTWSLTELGIFLETGELFAHGTFDVPYTKAAGNILNLLTLVTALGLTDVVNVTIGTNASLASTAAVHNLIAPPNAYTNAVVVQDLETTNKSVSNVEESSGGLAVRYGSGGLDWAFLGYDLQYNGYPDNVTSASSFALDVSSNGFWLNDQEIVVIQVLTGAGEGESRRVQFTAPNNFTVLDNPYSALLSQSVLHIWRSTKEQLPTRDTSINPQYVLGFGENTWNSGTAATTLTSVTPSARQLLGTEFTGDGTTTSFQLPLTFSSNFAYPGDFLLFLDGVESSYELGYSISTTGALVFLVAPAAGNLIEVKAFLTTASLGAYLIMSIVEYSTLGVQTAFNTSVVPDSMEYVHVYVDGMLQHTSAYSYVPTAVVFNVAPTGMVTIVQFTGYEQNGSCSSVVRVDAVQSELNTPIPTGLTSVDASSILAYVNGLLVPTSQYSVVGSNNVQLGSGYVTGSLVSLLILDSQSNVITSTGATGIDTGPKWVDPAGVSTLPNKVLSSVVSYTGNGVSTSFNTGVAPDFVIVFVEGLFQFPTQYTVNAVAHTVNLNDAPAALQDVDIFVFQTVSDAGEALDCASYEFTTDASFTVYSIPVYSGPGSEGITMVTLGGVYQHQSTYTLVPGVLTFNVPVDGGLNCEVWTWVSVPNPGQLTLIANTEFDLIDGVTAYFNNGNSLVTESLPNVRNTLLFFSTVFQNHHTYNVSTDPVNGYQFNVPNTGIPSGVHAYSLVFLTGLSSTRLALNSDLQNSFYNIPQMNHILEDMSPAGSFLTTASINTPNGYLPADGSVYFPIDYPVLYAEIGRASGWTGSEFAVPNIPPVGVVRTYIKY